jgi:hypothetical protein
MVLPSIRIRYLPQEAVCTAFHLFIQDALFLLGRYANKFVGGSGFIQSSILLNLSSL